MRGVAVHWSVTPAAADHAECEKQVAQIVAQHEAQGYKPSPAYNWLACQHGVVFEGRGWGMKSAANGTTASNEDYWAICALQAPGDSPTDALLSALRSLIDTAPDVEKMDVQPHSYFFPTQCCGDELRAWIEAGAPNPFQEALQQGVFDVATLLLLNDGSGSGDYFDGPVRIFLGGGDGRWGALLNDTRVVKITATPAEVVQCRKNAQNVVTPL